MEYFDGIVKVHKFMGGVRLKTVENVEKLLIKNGVRDILRLCHKAISCVGGTSG